MFGEYSKEETYKLLKKATGQKIDAYERLELDHAPRTNKELMLELLDSLVRRDVLPSTTEERITNLELKVKRIDLLEAEIRELKDKMNGKEVQKPHLTAADIVYEENKMELERKHFGKIVAIDAESGKIVGIGRDMFEAYKNASKKSKKTKFAFRKVGYQSICKLR